MTAERFPSFGHPEWFAAPDALRRFYWDIDATARLAGPEGLDLRPGLLVADVGCGWGYLGHLLRGFIAPGGRIDGYDLDEEQVARARERATTGLRFAHGDAWSLEVEDGAYDRAVCQTLLCHQSQPDRVLDELSRIVRPGGRVVAIEPAGPWERRDGLGDQGGEADLSTLLAAAQRGAQAVGAGDPSVGPRTGELFAAAGLEATTWTHTIELTWPHDVDAEPAFRGDDEADEVDAMRPLVDAAGAEVGLVDRVLRGAQRRVRERRQRLADGGPLVLWRELTVCVGRTA